MHVLSRWRRILQKLSLRVQLAGKVLFTFDDSYGRGNLHISFSQDGEDLIAWRLFNELGIPRPRYLDIGANDPERLSNTALFHLLGCDGMTVEPNPELHALLVRHRPGAINLNIGIGPVAGALTFHRMVNHSLSTFSDDEARRLVNQEEVALRDRLAIPVRPVREVLDSHSFHPDFLSLDVEGTELAILQSYDWERHRPAVICVETIGYSRRGDRVREDDTREFLRSGGYSEAAQTLCNSLFVDWNRRRQP